MWRKESSSESLPRLFHPSSCRHLSYHAYPSAPPSSETTHLHKRLPRLQLPHLQRGLGDSAAAREQLSTAHAKWDYRSDNAPSTTLTCHIGGSLKIMSTLVVGCISDRMHRAPSYTMQRQCPVHSALLVAVWTPWKVYGLTQSHCQNYYNVTGVGKWIGRVMVC